MKLFMTKVTNMALERSPQVMSENLRVKTIHTIRHCAHKTIIRPCNYLGTGLAQWYSDGLRAG
jgi:hypothetical protein